MPMKTKEETMSFGARLAALRKAAGFTQQELANEVGTSRRMIAYYEGQTAHPPTTLLPAIATALRITTDELLGQAPVKRIAKSRDTRLERRLQQIERGQLKRKVQNKQAA